MSLIERSDPDRIGAMQIAGALEAGRDQIIETLSDWRAGSLTYLEIATWATEAMDGSLGRLLYDDEGALVCLAELMALDGPDLTAAQRTAMVEATFSRI